MHLLATNVCMWMRVMTLQTVQAGLSESRSAAVTDNSSLLSVTPGALYSLLHYNATPSSSPAPPAAAAVTRIHLSGIGLDSHYNTHWNATGDSSTKHVLFIYCQITLKY